MGQETSDLVLFFGRFHPLILHLPIGFLVIAFALEILSRFGRFRSYRSAVRFVLFAGAAFSVVAAVLGLMLSQAGGYNPELLSIHQWTGIAVAIAACASFVLKRVSGSSRMMDRLYLFAFSMTIVFLMAAGHYGGSLTHGSDYLTQHMPNALRKISGLPTREKKSAPVITDINEAEIFSDIIYPILDARCVSCHNDDKRKGELMMHTIDDLMAGGENGPVLTPGNADKSGMMERIHLPESHDDHMPPKGKSQLSDDQIELLTWWINEGAPFDKKVAEVEPGENVRSILNTLVDPDANKTEVEKLLATQVDPADEKTLREIQDRGILVRPLAHDMNWLQANVKPQNTQPADSVIHAFSGVSEQLTWLNLGGTGTTDELLASIVGFKNLTRLHLENTRVTDKGLKHLKKLPYLEYLNLYGTRVTDAGIHELATLSNLRKLYVWQTNVTSEGVAKLKKALPGLEVNQGIIGDREDSLKALDEVLKTGQGSRTGKSTAELVKNE